MAETDAKSAMLVPARGKKSRWPAQIPQNVDNWAKGTDNLNRPKQPYQGHEYDKTDIIKVGDFAESREDEQVIESHNKHNAKKE